MVKQYSQLYAEVRRRILEVEEEPFASQLARQLICHFSGKSRDQFILERDHYASDAVCDAVEDAVQRVIAQEPLAYIFGEWSFYGLELFVDHHVLIPRDDTCALAEFAMRKGLFSNPNPRILDLCTGSGCIGLAVASRVKDSRVTLADISIDALAVAKKNINRLHMSGRVSCVHVDALQPAPEYLGKYHMIMSNPPYITTEEMKILPESVLEYEPHLALHGGDDGLVFYRSIVENFTPALQPGGYLCFEYGEGQGDDVCDILVKRGYTIVDRVRDFNNTERAVLAQYDRKDI